MKEISFNKIVKLPYSKNAIIRNDFPGFKEDYLVIHCLIRKYKPKTFMEIGTSSGMGTKVICNALGLKRDFWKFWKRKEEKIEKEIKVFSIDVPPGTDPKILYPHGEDGHPKKAGEMCHLPYRQIFGNSFNFDFSPYYPLKGWFIDGKHNYKFVKNDTELALKSNPIIIIWHDADIQEVNEAITEVMKQHDDYDLFRVLGTRIAFAVRR